MYNNPTEHSVYSYVINISAGDNTMREPIWYELWLGPNCASLDILVTYIKLRLNLG